MNEKTTNTRKPRTNIDRSSHKYSASDFMQMSHKTKFEYAEQYLLITKDAFDASKKFQFSYETFVKLCEDDGIIKSQNVLDTKSEKNYHFVTIDRKEKTETTRKPFTLAKKTAEKFDKLFEDNVTLTTQEKARVISILLDEYLDTLLKEKDENRLVVQVVPVNDPYVFL